MLVYATVLFSISARKQSGRGAEDRPVTSQTPSSRTHCVNV